MGGAKKRRSAIVVLCILAAGCARRASPGRAAAQPPPNVVLISVDTLRRDALRAYSEDAVELPELDRFAAQAATFSRAHSTASWTLPATASMLCGLYPDRHGASAPSRKLPDEVPTLAGALAEHGYETVGFTEGGYLHESYGLRSGFQRYNAWAAIPADRAKQKRLPRAGMRTKNTGGRLFDRAVEFLRQREADAPPFFLFLQTYTVHDYFRVRPWARRRVSGDLREKEHYRDCLQGVRDGDAEDWRRMRELYRAELQHFDEGFGRLERALVERGVAQHTWLVLTSDHGEGFDADRGRIHHGGRLHEDQLRIPLLVRGPGVVPREIARRVSLVDVMPTLLELAGAPAVTTDGISLAAALLGADEPSAERPLFAMEHHHYWRDGERREVDEPRETALAVAVLRGSMWYIEDEAGAPELYDMDADPGQRASVAASAEAGELRALARERRAIRSSGETHEPPPDVLEQLEQLGYAGDSR